MQRSVKQVSQGKSNKPKEEFKSYVAQAVVKAVPSGDSLVLHCSKGPDQFDSICYLAFVSAPRVGNPNRKEEPFGFEARELVRTKLIGKKVTFKLEYMANGKRFVSIKVPGTEG
jgi:hypothetical protein